MSILEFLLKRVSISVHVHMYSIYTLHTTTISPMCVVFNFLFKSGENNVKLIHEIYTLYPATLTLFGDKLPPLEVTNNSERCTGTSSGAEKGLD